MVVDVNVFLGAYPFRRVPGTSPEGVLSAMDRVGIERAWVSHLPGLFWRDPMEGNPWLYDTTTRVTRFSPVPAIHPGLPGWEESLAQARERRVPAVRCDFSYYGLSPVGSRAEALAAACGVVGVPLMLAVRLEDGRQRHPLDTAPELAPSAVRTLIRCDPRLRLVVTHAERSFIEEVHFGSTPAEAERIWWDISWVWGPPEDHLETLLHTIGVDRFVFGTGLPLRLPETAIARLDLLDLGPNERSAIESGNAERIPSEVAAR